MEVINNFSLDLQQPVGSLVLFCNLPIHAFILFDIKFLFYVQLNISRWM